MQRALDRRLYLILYGKTHGAPSGKPVWHFPEKVYDSEETLRKVMIFFCFFIPFFLFCYSHINTKYLQCAESALKSVIGDLSKTYFVGNAPMGHMVIQQTDNVPEPYKVF